MMNLSPGPSLFTLGSQLAKAGLVAGQQTGPTPTATPFDLATSYHEAGHAIGHLRLNKGFYAAHVLPRGVTTFIDRMGQLQQNITGLTEIEPFHFPNGAPLANYSAADARVLRREGLYSIIASLAGPIAELRYRKEPPFCIMGCGVANDWAEAECIAGWLDPDDDAAKRSLLARGVRLADAFVTREYGAITRIARILARRGTISGDDPIVRALRK